MASGCRAATASVIRRLASRPTADRIGHRKVVEGGKIDVRPIAPKVAHYRVTKVMPGIDRSDRGCRGPGCGARECYRGEKLLGEILHHECPVIDIFHMKPPNCADR